MDYVKYIDILKLVGLIFAIAFWLFAVQSKIEAHIVDNAKSHVELLLQHGKQLPILRQICRNTSKTEAALDRCELVE